MIDICANLGIILCSDIRWGLIITATASVVATSVVAASVVAASVTALVVAFVVAVVSVAEVTAIVALAVVLLFGCIAFCILWSRIVLLGTVCVILGTVVVTVVTLLAVVATLTMFVVVTLLLALIMTFLSRRVALRSLVVSPLLSLLLAFAVVATTFVLVVKTCDAILFGAECRLLNLDDAVLVD